MDEEKKIDEKKLEEVSGGESDRYIPPGQEYGGMDRCPKCGVMSLKESRSDGLYCCVCGAKVLG